MPKTGFFRQYLVFTNWTTPPPHICNVVLKGGFIMPSPHWGKGFFLLFSHIQQIVCQIYIYEGQTIRRNQMTQSQKPGLILKPEQEFTSAQFSKSFSYLEKSNIKHVCDQTAAVKDDPSLKRQSIVNTFGLFTFLPVICQQLKFQTSYDTYEKTSGQNAAVLLDFVQMRGGGPLQFFCHLFISAFLVYKRSLFPPKCQ